MVPRIQLGLMDMPCLIATLRFFNLLANNLKFTLIFIQKIDFYDSTNFVEFCRIKTPIRQNFVESDTFLTFFVVIITLFYFTKK